MGRGREVLRLCGLVPRSGAGRHDGRGSTLTGFTPQRIVCENTLEAAIHNRESKLLRVRHRAGQIAALDDIMRSIDIAKAEFVANCDAYRRLMAHHINPTDLARYVRVVLNVPGDDVQAWDHVSEVRKRQYNEIIDKALRGVGQDFADLTLWSAYNGVTEWLTHSRIDDPAKRRASLLFGSSHDMNRRALDTALAIAV